MLAIAVTNSKDRLYSASLLINSWNKDWKRQPTTPWTPQMVAPLAAELFNQGKIASALPLKRNFWLC